MGLLQAFALALLAGVLLNLTPCVLPAIPVKIRSISGSLGDTPLRRLFAAVALLAGTLTFFGALAAAAVWLNWTWGTLFQSQSFRLALSAVLAALGVSSLAGRGWQPPQWVYHRGRRSYAEPYLAGLLAAVLSTPCTGPFLGGVLAFALTQSPAMIVLLFLAVGLGLALPYLLLLARPGWLARLPRGGLWMVRIRQLLGWVLLAGAVFFAASALPGWSGRLLWWALLIGVGSWVLYSMWVGPGVAARLLPAALIAAGTGLVLSSLLASPAGNGHLDWRPADERALARARRDDHPVLVEFTADWCINCKVLERTVYNDPAVIEAAAEAGMLAFRVDLTRSVPHLQRLLRGYGGAGLPFAIVLDGNGDSVQRLPDLFTTKTLVAAIREARNQER